ncbi:hypothetical protein VNI00_009943 [Paramarasmius palmivorus]|uniref:Uncharacterized protein n=1 Tax=Paramarasmius palmivorus TaxID=297713 RepID=A0AAW0CQR3_9AGAR
MLPQNYNLKQAGTQLEKLATSRTEKGFTMNQLACFAEKLDWKNDSVDATQTGTRECLTWRLTEINEEGVTEEIVFSVQGIIAQCDLPPIMRPFGKNTSARNIQQRIIITGLDQPTFLQSIQGINRVNAMLRKHIREETIPDVHTYVGDYHAIEISNRYFTSRRFAGNETHVPFSTDIDPKGHLEQMKTDNFIHSTENDVAYYERRHDTSGRTRHVEFDTIPPSRLRVGDIVEVQLTLAVVETQGKGLGKRDNAGSHQYKTRLVLRGITLMDSRFSEESRVSTITNKQAPATLKRKVGYFAEEELETQEQLKRMAIDQQEGDDDD